MFSSNLNTLSAFSLMSYLSSHSSSPPAEGAGGKPNLKNILQLPLTIRCRDGKSPQLNSVLQLPLSPRRRGWGQEPKNILQLPLTIRCRDGKSPQLNSILQLPLSSGEGAGGEADTLFPVSARCIFVHKNSLAPHSLRSCGGKTSELGFPGGH
jgi:hypothetical protein